MCSWRLEIYIEVGWPEINDIFGPPDTPYVHMGIMFFVKYVDRILGHLAYMSWDRIFSQIATLNDLFHTVIKTKKINNTYNSTFWETRKHKNNHTHNNCKFKLFPIINPIKQTDLVNNFPFKMSSLAILWTKNNGVVH